MPKLFINCEEGHALAGEAGEFFLKWPNQTEISLKGRYYFQKDFPYEIGEGIADFVKNKDLILQAIFHKI